MPKYYLLGGENTHKRDAEEINQRAFNDAESRLEFLCFLGLEHPLTERIQRAN